MNTPAETAARFLAVGREKVLLPVGRMACLAVMAGFFIGLAGVAFLYILDRYAETRGWDVDDTLLRGTFFRLAFGRRKQLRKRFRHRKG